MYILVLFDSKTNKTKELAYLIAKGIESCGIEARIRRVAKVSNVCEATEPEIATHGTPYVTIDDLKNCAGLALGSPTYFGSISSSMKYFLEQTIAIWLQGELVNKPACVFTSTGSMHGGHESNLLSMMIPLIHHGMIMLGLPYDKNLRNTITGGTPYGISHLASEDFISEEEKTMAINMGKRIANITNKLH